nr:immunoglobulin heavy chain junction region [Mus musculus]
CARRGGTDYYAMDYW